MGSSALSDFHVEGMVATLATCRDMVGSPPTLRTDLLIRWELKRCPRGDCACQLHGTSFKDFMSLVDLQ